MAAGRHRFAPGGRGLRRIAGRIWRPGPVDGAPGTTRCGSSPAEQTLVARGAEPGSELEAAQPREAAVALPASRVPEEDDGEPGAADGLGPSGPAGAEGPAGSDGPVQSGPQGHAQALALAGMEPSKA